MPAVEFNIVRLEDLAGVSDLAELARSEGFRMLDRLVLEWSNGVNRFEKPGELLLGANVNGRLVGTAGLNRQSEAVGRIRRVYVDPSYRRLGIATALIRGVVGSAGSEFEAFVLRTHNPEAAKFYESLGFVAGRLQLPESATHSIKNVRA